MIDFIHTPNHCFETNYSQTFLRLTGLWEWCGQSETVENVIINSKNYDEERKMLREEIWRVEEK